LKTRFALPLSALLAVSTGAYGAVSYAYSRFYLTEESNARAHTIATSLGTMARYAILTGDRPTLERLTRGALEQQDVVSVELRNKRGESLYRLGSSNAEGLSRIESVVRAEEGAFELDPGLDDDERHAKGGEEIGTVILGFSHQSLDSGLARQLQVGALTLVVVMLIALLALLRLMRSVIDPIARVARVADRIAAGDLESRAPVEGKSDEVDRLAQPGAGSDPGAALDRVAGARDPSDQLGDGAGLGPEPA
jgi:HAMP domain-containing protein